MNDNEQCQVNMQTSSVILWIFFGPNSELFWTNGLNFWPRMQGKVSYNIQAWADIGTFRGPRGTWRQYVSGTLFSVART